VGVPHHWTQARILVIRALIFRDDQLFLIEAMSIDSISSKSLPVQRFSAIQG